MSKFTKIKIQKIVQSQTYTALILGTDHQQVVIYTEPFVTKQLHQTLNQEEESRPSTHNLLQNVLSGLGAIPFQTLIHDCKNSVYFTKLFLESQQEDKKVILEIDARPSDCLVLALLYDIPIYCKEELLADIAI